MDRSSDLNLGMGVVNSADKDRFAFGWPQVAMHLELPHFLVYYDLLRGAFKKICNFYFIKESLTSKHGVIFQYSLLQHQCIFATFLRSFLFLEKILSLVLKTTLQQHL